jgi:hypothetical protein
LDAQIRRLQVKVDRHVAEASLVDTHSDALAETPVLLVHVLLKVEGELSTAHIGLSDSPRYHLVSLVIGSYQWVAPKLDAMENERTPGEKTPRPTRAEGVKPQPEETFREGLRREDDSDWARAKLETTLRRVIAVQLLELEELMAKLRAWGKR